MFSYYGRKKKIIKKYPKPKHTQICEPFAGSASYAFEYWENDIVLIDGFYKVVEIWRYLQQTTKEEILALPNVNYGEYLDNFTQLSDVEKWLIGYCINNGSTIPKKTPRNGNFNSWNRDKDVIAENLYKIKHWRIYQGEYDSFPLQGKWTYFVDPPYQFNKYKYGYNTKLDYNKLAEWCKTRDGQVIACDNDGANWLPFEKLLELSGQVKKSTEMIWHKEG